MTQKVKQKKKINLQLINLYSTRGSFSN